MIVSVAFNEDIFFDHPHTVKGVMISMRKALHDYFGISEVKPIETGEPQLMIVAGITSKESEMCLQVSRLLSLRSAYCTPNKRIKQTNKH